MLGKEKTPVGGGGGGEGLTIHNKAQKAINDTITKILGRKTPK